LEGNPKIEALRYIWLKIAFPRGGKERMEGCGDDDQQCQRFIQQLIFRAHQPEEPIHQHPQAVISSAIS